MGESVMNSPNRCAKINVKLLVILILVTLALGIGLVAARQVRREILSETSLTEGQAAFEREDWLEACKNFKDYLDRNPDDVEILKKYAKARMSIRPFSPEALQHAISAYRLVIQFDPLDKDAYEQLASLYAGIGNFDELVHIARTKLKHDPNDLQAPLWLANGLTRTNKPQEARKTLETFINALEPLENKPIEYVRACVGMSEAIIADDPKGKADALMYLDKAVSQAPESQEALLTRARFYARMPDIGDLSDEERLAQARQDLDAADGLEAAHPRSLLLLGSEWMAHGKLDRAEAKLREAENVELETIQEHFFDVNDWVVARFNLALDLAGRKGDIGQGTDLVKDALATLKEARHRVQILPSAITLSVDSDNASHARVYLDEYLEYMKTREDSAAITLRLAYLKALVASAERRPYEVIDILQPVVVNATSRPEFWALLADSYSQTNQNRRAIGALGEYLRLRPKDVLMTAKLANVYLKLRNWSKVFETAEKVESLDPSNSAARFLRIEAEIHLAAERSGGPDTSKLEELSDELAELDKEYPDRPEIRAMKAGIAEYLGNTGEVEKMLKAAIESSTDSLNAELQLARHYQQAGKTPQAIDVCKAACGNHPGLADPWILLSDLHLANSDYDSAVDCLQQGQNTATEKQEKRSISTKLALLGLTQNDAADREAAIKRLTELAEQDKNDIHTRTLLLGIREVLEDTAKARKLIDELKEIEGESGLLWRMHEASMWFASAEWRSKQQDIVNLLQSCIASDPGWTAPVLLLADFYQRLDDLGRAEDVCRQALSRGQSDSIIANKLLLILERQGRFSEAAQVLRNSRQSGMNTRLASDWAVRIAVRTGDLSQAIEELKIKISNDDEDADSRIQLAHLIYQQEKDADLAFQYLDQAEAIRPGSMSVKAARVSILTAEGRQEEARQILDNSVAKDTSFQAYMMRAEYLSSQGQFEAAESDYKKLTTFTENGVAGYGLLSDYYARNKKLDQAITILERALKEYPEDLRLKQRMMQLLFTRGNDRDMEDALAILTELEEQLPNDPTLMKLRARHALSQQTPQSVENARTLLEAVVKLAPKDVDAHLILIDIAIQNREYETARSVATRALGLNPDNLALLSARSRIELAADNARLAAELAGVVLRKDPDHPEAQDLLVRAALKSKDRDLLNEAGELLDSALKDNPADEKVLISRAQVFTAIAKPELVIPELQAYCQIEDATPSVEAITTLADLYRLTGNMDEAEKRIQQAEQMAPDSQTVIHARVLWLLAQNRASELSSISSAYISAPEQNPNILVVAAAILSASDSADLKNEGLKLYEHTTNVFPGLVSAQLGRASTLYQLGDSISAKKAYQQVLDQYPNNVQALNDLAWILQESDKDLSGSLELANKGLSIAPNDPHLLDTRGTILTGIQGRIADAMKDFERLLELPSSNARQQAKAHLQLGRIFLKLGDNNKAKQHLQKALDTDKKTRVLTPEDQSEIMQIIGGSGI